MPDARAIQVPKGMTLLVSKEDFKWLVEFSDDDPVIEAPVEYTTEVILAKWHGEERTVTRTFRSKTRADAFCRELRIAGGKVVKEPTGVTMPVESVEPVRMVSRG